MNPDTVVGVGLVATSVVGYAASWAACRCTLTRRTALEPDEGNVLAIARAVGVLAGLEQTFARNEQAYARMEAAIEWHAVRALPDVIDHTLCQGDCGRVLCCCLSLHTAPRCEGTTEQACGHLQPLCEFCAPGLCFECLTERLSDTSWYGGESR